jgi:chaperonin GroEL (HSP60 family)
MRFFIANDRDYATRKEVASVYLDKNRSYMLTGNTVDRIGDGKPIGKAYGQIRETQDYMRNYYGYSNEEARHYVSPADKLKLDMAKEAYFKETETAVQNLIANPRVNKSYLDFYFEPIVGKKSHKLKGFNLIDVAFKNFLSSFQ